MFFDSTSAIIASTDRDVFHSLQRITAGEVEGGCGAGRWDSKMKYKKVSGRLCPWRAMQHKALSGSVWFVRLNKRVTATSVGLFL
jgi:hypothetical protein